MSLDIVIPALKSTVQFAELFEKLDHSLSQANITYKFLVVDLGMTPTATEKLSDLKKNFPLVFIKKNQGITTTTFLANAWKESSAPFVAILDPELTYSPDILPKLYSTIQSAGLVVTKKQYQPSNLVSKLFHNLAEKLANEAVHEFEQDKLLNLKLMRRDVLQHMFKQNRNISSISPIIASQELGYAIKVVEIEEKHVGARNIQHQFQIITQVLSHKLKGVFSKSKSLSIAPAGENTMAGAGFVHRQNRYITHTTLLHEHSAAETFSLGQKIVILGLLAILFFGLSTTTLLTLKIVVAILSLIYFIDVLFNLFLILKSLHTPPEIQISKATLDKLNDKQLPIYTILCPLYKEAQVLPQFLTSIDNLDWPKKKLDVILLLEEDDTETVETAKAMNLPSYVRILIVPDSHPKTKPKACNYGLNHAKGEYIVIYDAEDAPDSDQLKKVYAAFQKTHSSVKCIQAKLNYYNPHQNLLTRFFTAEYSLWFDVILTGLQTINTTIPLGGTSNHFRTKDLLELEGWDPFNVTEDCDLGIRLFKRGARTAVIDSVTLEEANSHFFNWLRQRSRWIKGYMQTYLLHMRNPLNLIKSHGWHALILQLSIGGKIAFLLINPIMWILTLSYFLLYAYVGPAIESLYPAVIFYMAVFSLVFGNFMFIYYYMIGIAKREHWSVMKYVLIVPIYWLMASIAAVMALQQLIFKPHYWEKTVHGLHLEAEKLTKPLQNKTKKSLPESLDEIVRTDTSTPQQTLPVSRIRKLWSNKNLYLGGIFLVGGSIVANLLNFVFNAYLGRTLSLADFGTLSLFSSFVYLSMIPLGALSASLTHKVAFIEGRHGEHTSYSFWSRIQKKIILISVAICLLWVILIPIMSDFFNTTSLVPFVLIVPMLLIGIPISIDRGFLSGQLLFTGLAFAIVIDAVIKLIAAYVLVDFSAGAWVYASIPIGLTVSFLVSRIVILLKKRKISVLQKDSAFPKRFFVTSMLAGIAQMSFLSLDVLLVKHFMSAGQAGEYALISLLGKMVFFAAGMAGHFIIPLVSRNEGSKKDSQQTFAYTLLATLLLATSGFVALGIFSPVTAPILLGDRIVPLTGLLPLFTFGVLCFSLGQNIVNYYLAKKHYFFVSIPVSLTVFQIIGITAYHHSIGDVVAIMSAVGIANLLCLAFLHKFSWMALSLQNNIDALFSLLSKKNLTTKGKAKSGRLKILIFNWYDVKHSWGGGAEFYVHNIARTLVANGHKVTIFCGNDGQNPRNEVVDGVQIVRRGGLFTVPIWGWIYYVLKFRGLFDVVIDSAKGVPFFSPLYVRKPIVALICHVHQEMFKLGLPFPLAQLAMGLEKIMMPFIYRDTPLVTISESSKKAIQKLGFGKNKNISVAIPGVSITKKKTKKTAHPSVLYLGRLRDYKSVDTLIHAIDRIKNDIPNVQLTIAGDGDARESLENLTEKLNLSSRVKFLMRVSEERKAQLFSESWVVVHPSIVEGWGITNIEANFCATPVIASNVDGLRDSVVDGKTGILVPPRDIYAFAQAIKKILTDTDFRTSLSEECLVWAKNFSWKKSAEMFIESFQSQLKEKYQYTLEKKVVLAQK